ncbi:unnamed protein product, partial [Protopolystoma xenopodis]
QCHFCTKAIVSGPEELQVDINAPRRLRRSASSSGSNMTTFRPPPTNLASLSVDTVLASSAMKDSSAPSKSCSHTSCHTDATQNEDASSSCSKTTTEKATPSLVSNSCKSMAGRKRVRPSFCRRSDSARKRVSSHISVPTDRGDVPAVSAASDNAWLSTKDVKIAQDGSKPNLSRISALAGRKRSCASNVGLDTSLSYSPSSSAASESAPISLSHSQSALSPPHSSTSILKVTNSQPIALRLLFKRNTPSSSGGADLCISLPNTFTRNGSKPNNYETRDSSKPNFSLQI